MALPCGRRRTSRPRTTAGHPEAPRKQDCHAPRCACRRRGSRLERPIRRRGAGRLGQRGVRCSMPGTRRPAATCTSRSPTARALRPRGTAWCARPRSWRASARTRTSTPCTNASTPSGTASRWSSNGAWARSATSSPTARSPARNTVALGIKLAGALETVHRAGFAHAAVDPANVLLTEWAEPVLANLATRGAQSTARTARSRRRPSTPRPRCCSARRSAPRRTCTGWPRCSTGSSPAAPAIVGVRRDGRGRGQRQRAVLGRAPDPAGRRAARPVRPARLVAGVRPAVASARPRSGSARSCAGSRRPPAGSAPR